MNAVTFDTLRFARDLEENGAFSASQAARLAETLSAALGADLATKSDVRESGAALKAEVRESAVSLKADVRESETTLTARLRDSETVVRTELRESEATLKAKLRETELRLEAKLAETKADLLKWLFGLVGFQTLVIVGSLAALARPFH